MAQTFWQSEIFDVQPHFISFLKIHLSSGLVKKILVLFMRLYAPSVWGRNEVLSWAPNPCASTRLAKTCFWTLGFNLTQCLRGGHDAWTCMKNNFPMSWVVAFSLMGIKCAMLLNQSSTIMITSNPLMVANSPWSPWTHFPTIIQKLVMIATIMFVSYWMFDFVGKLNKYSHIPLHHLSN